MDTRIPLLLGCICLFSASTCKVYDSSLFTEGAGGAGGTGGTALCSTPADCPGTDDECKKRACVGGFCSLDFAAKDMEITAQTPGDCQVVICDGQGNLQAVPTSDPPDDSRECTLDSCINSVPKFEQKATGTLCTEGGGKKCNDAGACVECLSGSDCASTVCDTGTFKCAPASCGDKILNGTETDMDCGGGECPACGAGKTCMNDSDCTGQECSITCQESCKDKIANNEETDVDCGGPNCAPCGIGLTCDLPVDCTTNNCVSGTCFINHLVINEVDYDQVGPDTEEFIEVYNGTGAAKSLSGLALVLVNGENNMSYLSFDLTTGGTLAAGQYLVLGATPVKPAAGAIKLTFANAADNIQNGSNMSNLGDGIALIDTKAKTLLDALAYEGALPMAPVTGLPSPVNLVEGTALPASVADNNAITVSLCRLPNGADADNAASDWKLSSTPTPGAENVP